MHIYLYAYIVSWVSNHVYNVNINGDTTLHTLIKNSTDYISRGRGYRQGSLFLEMFFAIQSAAVGDFSIKHSASAARRSAQPTPAILPKRATRCYNHRMSTIQAETVDFLLSPQGRAAAEALHSADLSEANTLSLLNELRCTFAPAQAGALLTLARARQRAGDKFPDATALFFTPEALEQATPHAVAIHRADRLAQLAPPGPILDLGCGIGGDALALAQQRPVIAYECDPIRLRFARANAAALGLAERIEFRQADWRDDLRAGRLAGAAAAFADPARRIDGRRVFSLHEMQPPLTDLLALQEQVPALAVKVMPGVQDAELPDTCSVGFTSHAGVCKEAVLWFGPLRKGKNGEGAPRWASVHTGDGWHHVPAYGEPPPLGALEAGQILHEPDPALIRAGAFAELCRALGAHVFDRQIAYLVTSRAGSHPLTQSFAILERLPLRIKQINRRLRELNIGRVELKKRGVPIEPESLRPQLKPVPGGDDAVLIFTRCNDRRFALIARRMDTRSA